VLGANTHLPANIAVTWARAVPAHFNARHSATARGYQYLIANRHSRAGLWHGRVSWEYHALDVDAMRQAAVALLGRHDFSSFRGQGCQSRHAVRHLTQLHIAEHHGLLVFSVRANAFLLHMVRNIVGTLLEVGRGRREPAWSASVLAARDRRCAGMTAPAQGLYLTAVEYPTEFALPAPPQDVLRLTAFSGPAYDS
jgi:tRNA pseudouridine38-40 synthase